LSETARKAETAFSKAANTNGEPRGEPSLTAQYFHESCRASFSSASAARRVTSGNLTCALSVSAPEASLIPVQQTIDTKIAQAKKVIRAAL